MGKVIDLKGRVVGEAPKCLAQKQLDAIDVLEEAKRKYAEEVIVLGRRGDECFFISSTNDERNMLWLVERFKKELFE